MEIEWCRNQYVSDLGKLAELIYKFDAEGIFQNTNTVLYRAQSKVNGKRGDIIEVDIRGIEVILKKKMSGTIPNDLDSVSIYLESCSHFDTSIDIQTNDRIQDGYNFQVAITGINKDGEHHNAWHLDKDIRKTDANKPKVSHPLYHFQAGGNNLEEKEISGAVFLGAPRLPHPPMDAILGLHFILKNFCSTKDYTFLNKIFSNPDYEDIIERAQDRMFKPYFKAFEKDNSHQDFTVKSIFPLAS